MLSHPSRFALAAALIAAPGHAETAYFVALDDVPLPPGFVELDAGAGFEAEAGLIVVALAVGPATDAEVRAFYLSALPPLGWALSPGEGATLTFARGRERLALSFSRDADGARLQARLVRSRPPGEAR